LNNVI